MQVEEYRLEVVEATDDPDSTYVIGVTPFEPGLSLRELRAAFGGDEGSVTHPVTGEAVPVSLAPWRDRDPDTTIIRVGFTTQL